VLFLPIRICFEIVYRRRRFVRANVFENNKTDVWLKK